MKEASEIDGQGRIYLPTSIRQRIKSTRFLIEVKDGMIVLKPLDRPIEKFYGIAKPPRYYSAEEIDRAVEDESEKIIRNDVHRR
ncbi:MAG: AbrB family transcriptional regulator [Candidatus Brockarchaeota archaeon]|nr:AbrB family transcriptional regulator [Candidatus Brockarchaeota archaeon]